MQRETLKRNILTVTAIVVMVGAVSVFLITFQKRMMKLLSEMSMQNISEMQELYAESLRSKFNDQLKTLDAQAAYFFDTKISDTDEIKKKATFALAIGDFKRIAVVNEDGAAMDLNGKNLPNMKNKPYFRNALLKNEVQFSDKVELDDNLNPCITMTYPFETKYKEKGVIAGFFSYDVLIKIFSIPIFSGQSYFYLLAEDGNILLFNKNQKTNIYNVNFYDYVRNEAERDNPELNVIKKDMIKGLSGHVTVDGVEGKKIFMYAPLKINGWYIITVLPYSYIENQQTRINLHVYVLLAAIVIALLIFALVIYSIVRKSREIQKDNERLTIANNQAQTLIFEYDISAQVVNFSGDTSFILGTDKKNFGINFIRAEYFTRVHPDDVNIFERVKQALNNDAGPFSAEFRYKNYGNTYFWVKMSGSCILGVDGRVQQFIGSITNVNSQVMHEQELRNIADRDRLSYLLNKAAFERNSREYFMRSGQNAKTALIIIDLDNFKDVNDKLGHMTGDLAIKDAAKKLSLIFNDKDYLGRFGGDEFCVLMCFDNSLTEENILKIVNSKAGDLVQSLREAYENEDQMVCITASIGIALYPEHGDSYEELFMKADQALYDVKQHGKDGFKIFNNRRLS